MYWVVERGGVVTEQLVVPRPYVSKVLFMAHSHLLGAHLGMDKTRARILDRFHGPCVKRDVILLDDISLSGLPGMPAHGPETLGPKPSDPNANY